MFSTVVATSHFGVSLALATAYQIVSRLVNPEYLLLAQQITVGVGVNFLASPCTVYSLALSGWWCGHLLAWSFRWQVMSEAS